MLKSILQFRPKRKWTIHFTIGSPKELFENMHILGQRGIGFGVVNLPFAFPCHSPLVISKLLGIIFMH